MSMSSIQQSCTAAAEKDGTPPLQSRMCTPVLQCLGMRGEQGDIGGSWKQRGGGKGAAGEARRLGAEKEGKAPTWKQGN